MREILDDTAELMARERLARRLFAELNQFVDLGPALQTVIERLRDLTDCHSIGVRLRQGHDYPYAASAGFSESFLREEDSLCPAPSGGAPAGTPAPECLCGAVLRGDSHSALPFTAGGSLWLNQADRQIAEPPAAELASAWHYRGACPAAGYRSLALVPIQARGERIGLLHLADPRPGMFSEGLIEFLEMIGEHLGLAIQNAQTYTRLKEAYEEIRLLRGMMPLCFRCRKVRDDQGYWHEVHEYLRREARPDSAHGLCPGCAGEMFLGT